MRDAPDVRGAVAPSLDGFDYVIILFRQKWLVIGIFIVAICTAYVIGKIEIPTYESVVSLAPYEGDNSDANSALGTLRGLGLVSGSSTGNQKAIALAMLDSRALLQTFITEHHLLPVLFPQRWDANAHSWKKGVQIPSLEDGYKVLHGTMKVESNSSNPLLNNVIVKLHVRWTNPVIAADWANGLVKLVNTTLQTKTIDETDVMIAYLDNELNRNTAQELRGNISNLIEEQMKRRMMAKGHDDFALIVIDPAEPATTPVAPRKLVLLAGGGLLGLLIGIPLGFLRHSWQLRISRTTGQGGRNLAPRRRRQWRIF